MADQDEEKRLLTVREAKREFDEAHRKGMKAIKEHDFEAVDEAITAEGKAVEKGMSPFKAPPD